MEDINSRLAEILGDPQSMEKVRKMAESIMSDGAADQSTPDGEDMETVLKITNILSRFKEKSSDNRVLLLQALKPHLSSKRQEKVDTAVKLLKLIEILPLLKECGILDMKG